MSKFNAHRFEKPYISKTETMTNLELLKEFRKRFNGSCLSAMEFQKALDEIGLTEIKHYLDNLELKVIKKPRRD